MNWICSQLGAREHYAIPRALQSQGRLQALYTDLRRSGLEKIENGRVTTFPAGGLYHLLRQKFQVSGAYDEYLRTGRWFSRAVRRQLAGQRNLGEHIFFSYDTGFLEAAEFARSSGATCVLGQMDPGRVEFDLVAEERERWKGWEPDAPPIPAAYLERREAEWQVADRIVVNSAWSRNALVAQGIPESRLSTIPLSYECDSRCPAPSKSERNPSRPFRVLWLGQVNLRKGIPYLIEAARRLLSENVEFLVAGPCAISEKALSTAPGNMSFPGKVSRDSIADVYRDADIFVLPTISDGFAITQIEAMAHGLPVITTSNCGDVVTDGMDGFIIPIRDADTLRERIARLIHRPDLLRSFSDAALEKAGQFGQASLGRHLARLAADIGKRPFPDRPTQGPT